MSAPWQRGQSAHTYMQTRRPRYPAASFLHFSAHTGRFRPPRSTRCTRQICSYRVHARASPKLLIRHFASLCFAVPCSSLCAGACTALLEPMHRALGAGQGWGRARPMVRADLMLVRHHLPVPPLAGPRGAALGMPACSACMADELPIRKAQWGSLRASALQCSCC